MRREFPVCLKWLSGTVFVEYHYNRRALCLTVTLSDNGALVALRRVVALSAAANVLDTVNTKRGLRRSRKLSPPYFRRHTLPLPVRYSADPVKVRFGGVSLSLTHGLVHKANARQFMYSVLVCYDGSGSAVFVKVRRCFHHSPLL
jgi:hypothetical protein